MSLERLLVKWSSKKSGLPREQLDRSHSSDETWAEQRPEWRNGNVTLEAIGSSWGENRRALERQEEHWVILKRWKNKWYFTSDLANLPLLLVSTCCSCRWNPRHWAGWLTCLSFPNGDANLYTSFAVFLKFVYIRFMIISMFITF